MSHAPTPVRAKHTQGLSIGQGFTGTTDQDILMKPLPLLDQSVPFQREPELLKAFKRTLLQARLRRLTEQENTCPHTKVENWLCSDCNQKVSSFGCVFDSFKGKVRTFMKVLYENDFLEDFQNAASGGGAINDDQSDCTGIRSSENFDNQILSGPAVGEGSASLDVLYQQYQPSNVTELREYMLFLICKKLKKQFKTQQSPLGPGHYNNLSNKLINYLQELQKQKKKLLTKYNNDILLFDSVFESGNLLQAEIVSPTEYQLYMQVDTNTRGHQQWFYFRVRNTKKNRKYTFRIMNFTKQGLASSAPPQGNAGLSNPGGGLVQGAPVNKKQDHLQKINFKSKLSGDTEWRVIDCDQIEFVKTSVQRKRKDILAAAADSDQEEMLEEMENEQACSQKLIKQKSPKKKKAQYYYALQFEVQFTQTNDSVYFAYSLPYTLSQMTEMIMLKENEIQRDATNDEEVKSQNNEDGLDTARQQPPNIEKPSQAQAIQGGTPIWQENGVTIEVQNKSIFYKREILSRSICGLPLYVITIAKDSKSYKKKPIIIITSRVHAAETPGSYVFDGMYNFLCSNSQEAKFLRKFYTFILVPTLNPDGVVCGNYRSSISGVDLNRQWIAPDEDFHPEIYSIKQLMKNFYEKERRQLWVYCDLHGHSKKKNAFFYGCNTAANGGFLSWTIVRLLPRIFAQKTHLFNYKDCRFKVEPYKLGTGRVVAWKQFMITHSFTLESSFYGYDFGEEEYKLFTEKEFFDVGVKFCQSVFELHFLWKSIRNELKLTNGWLKPRKLIEITGVPAAQLLNEELQKKKKEDLKKKAIEQYEQFLKKFYNKSDQQPTNQPENKPRRGSKLMALQNLQIKAEQPLGFSNIQNPQLSGPHKSNQGKSVGLSSLNIATNVQSTINKQTTNPLEHLKSRNNELTGAQSDNYQQSKKEKQISVQDDKPQENIYQLLIGLVKIQALIRGFLTRKKFTFQRQPFAVVNKVEISQRIPVLPTNFNPSQDEVAEGFNWREYFQEQELEQAYQIVEVEKEDDPEEDTSDGSSSNPSQDNFDIQEIYEQIYQIKNGKELAERRDEANQRFFAEINDQDYIDQQAMFNMLDDAFKGKPTRQINDFRYKGPFKQAKSFKIGESTKSNITAQISPDKQVKRRPSYFEQRNDQLLKKPETLSLLNQEDQSPLTAHQIIDPNKGNQSSHSRIQTGNQPKSLLTQGIIGLPFPQPQNLQQFKLFTQNTHAIGFGVQQSSSKKESIQQVIKDCFITKKIGNHQSSGVNHHFEGARVHSMNNYKLQGQQQLPLTTNIQQQNTSNTKKQSVKGARRGDKNNYNNFGQQSKIISDQREQIKQYFNHRPQRFTADDNYYTPVMVKQAESSSSQTSSLFMKYVKNKVGKRGNKTEHQQIPQQIADKYIDIYRELIDKEAQRKQEEQDFLRKHQIFHQGSIGSAQTGPFGTGHNGHLGNFHQSSNTGGYSRNGKNMKSEQRSRHQRQQQKGIHNHQTSRKEIIHYQNSMNQQSIPAHDVTFMGNKELLFTTHQQNKPTSEVIVRSTFDGETFLNIKHSIQKIDKRQELQSANRQRPYQIEINDINKQKPISNEFNNSFLKFQLQTPGGYQPHFNPVPISSSQDPQDPFFQGGNVKLPLINNFSSTLDYHSRSNYNIHDYQHPSVKSSSLGLHDQHQDTTPMIQEKHPPQSFQHFYNSFTQVKQQQQQADDFITPESVDSSIDEDMLDKIKNIYSEMRKNNSQSKQLQQSPHKIGGGIRQKRLMAGQNAAGRSPDMIGSKKSKE